MVVGIVKRRQRQGPISTPESWKRNESAIVTSIPTHVSSLRLKQLGSPSPGVVNNQNKVLKGISAIPYIHGFNIFTELGNFVWSSSND